MGKRVSIGHGVYQDEKSGTFFVRPYIGGARTWRALRSKTKTYAIKEAAAKVTDQERAKHGIGVSPYAREAISFSDLADAYLTANCPNRRLEARPGKFTASERVRIGWLSQFFGRKAASYIRPKSLTDYAHWRRENITKAGCTGNRAIDLELCTLSNVLTYGVIIEEIPGNPVAYKRPRFQTADLVKHSRERAIASGDELHRIADRLFCHPESEALGWLALFSALTGCRNIELRRLRMDGKDPATPGWISETHLFLRRAKRGIHPWIEIQGPLAAAIERFRFWHEMRFPKNVWWFPGRRDPKKPVDRDSLRHAIYRVCEELALPRVAPHGFRSFYVSLRRSEGAGDAQIASEIGDKTVAVISQSYGDVPPNWLGSKKLSFLPSEGLPAWERWQSSEDKIVAI